MLIQKSLLLLLLAEGVRNTAGYVQPNVSNYMSLNSRVHHPSTTSTLFAVKRFEKYHRMASKENKFIGALSSNLFSSRGMRERACSFDITTKAGVSSNNEDGDQSLFQKVCRATLGRLKAILLFILKLIFVIPFSTLKSIFTKKDKTYDGSEEIDEVNPEVVNVAEEATIATDDITDSQKKEKVLTKLNVEWTKETLSRVQKMETTSAPDEKVADDVIEEPVVEISALSLEADEEDNEQETSKLDSVEDEVESSEETPEAISEQVEENSKLYFVDEVESSEEEAVVKKKRRVKKWKDPNKPKRAMSAFFLYSQENRPRVKEESPDASFGDVARLLSGEYKALTDKQMKKYTKLAEADKARYVEAMESYVPTEEAGGKKKKAKKDPNAPKRNMSSYFLYSVHARPSVKEENPEATFGDIARLISKQFKALTDKEKKKWEKKALEDKERYKREMEVYTA